MDKRLRIVGLVLAALLLLCLAPMPYGFYTLVRFVAMIVFAVMAVDFGKRNKIDLCVATGALALLFQPFYKFALGRGLWNMVDLVVAALLVWLFFKNKEK